MSNGVFHNGLQKEAGNIAVQRRGVDVYGDLQPVLETGALNCQVEVQDFQFPAKGYLFAGGNG